MGEEVFWPRINLKPKDGRHCEAVVEFPETSFPTTHRPQYRAVTSVRVAEGSAEGASTEGDDSSKSSWMQTWKALMWLSFLLSLSCAAIAIYHLEVLSSARYILAWSVAAFFVAIAVPVAFHGIILNIMYYRHPLQRHYIRILFMIPIFSIESWCALRFKSTTMFLETMRATYEAYVIYCFFSLLREFLGATFEERVKSLESLQTPEKKHAHHIRAVFLCFTDYMPKWELGEQFLRNTSAGVLQFVFVRIAFAGMVLTLQNIRTSEPCYTETTRRSLELYENLRRTNSSVFNSTNVGELICPNYYGEGDYRWNRLHVYEVLIVNLSQTWAMYNMILFYHETLSLIRPLRPLTKLLSVKGVVFVAFWQNCIISGAVKVHWVTGYRLLSYSPSEVADALQNFLICMEMSFAAVLMHYAYSYKDFSPEGPLSEFLTMSNSSALQGVKDLIPEDMVKESLELGARVGKAVGRRFSHSAEPSRPPVHEVGAPVPPSEVTPPATGNRVAPEPAQLVPLPSSAEVTPRGAGNQAAPRAAPLAGASEL